MPASSSGPRMTQPTQAVLRALITEPTREFYGLEIGTIAGLPSGTIHPILARLEACEWLTSRWEDAAEAHQLGRPRRRYYSLTPDGAIRVRAALARVDATTSRLRRGLNPGLAGGCA